MSRSTCTNCEQVLDQCYCHLIDQQDNQIPILILKHSNEQKHYLSTVKIAIKSFKNIQVLTGEDFTYNLILNNFIKRYNPVVIYPTDNSQELLTQNRKIQINALIFLDGTWKKTYKILQLSKNLQKLQFLHFSNAPSPILFLRQPPKEGAISTLESICHVLQLLEKKSFSRVLKPLLYLQDRIWEKIPYHIKSNYNREEKL